eukprot:GHVT01027199.1.p1 GENE.GHVT01027199.1~~GHVT01027199.1.p1  ORF type:complete len:264 (+),score=-20.51 GHVT01027199.1:467-1258(+)
MSEISLALAKTKDSSYYKDIAIQYVKIFLKLGVSKDKSHLLGSYGNESSWSTQYNLYLDKLFEFKLFPDWVYEMQDHWYLLKSEGPDSFGPPLDSRALDRAKTDWLIWASAACKSPNTRNRLINSVTRYIRQTSNSVFGDLISIDGGWSIGFLVRPVVGGHFALLAHAPLSPSWNMSRIWAGVIGVIVLGFVGWRRIRARMVGRESRREVVELDSFRDSRWKMKKSGLGGGRGEVEDELEVRLLLRPVLYHQTTDPSIGFSSS